MGNRFITYLFVMFATASLLSCEEEYEIATPDFESKLVINSMMSKNSPWAVSVTNSINVLDEEQEIECVPATVEIFRKDGQFLYELTKNEAGYYSNGDVTPSAGQTYTVKVTASGFQTAMAQDKIPTDGELSIDRIELNNPDGSVSTELIFSIGKADKDTYLVWDLYKSDEIAEGGISEDDRSLVNVWLGQLSTAPRKFFSSKRPGHVIKTFDGSVTTTLDALVQEDGGRGELENVTNDVANGDRDPDESDLIALGGGGDGTDGSGSGDGGDGSSASEITYELRVMTISKELHDYYISLEQYFENTSSLDVPPSAIHSNVENGYGIFASYNEQVITF